MLNVTLVGWEGESEAENKQGVLEGGSEKSINISLINKE